MDGRALFTNRAVETSRIIYTPSLFARSSLFFVQEVGTLRAVQPHTSRRSGLDSFLLFAVLDGSGRLTYEGRTYELRAGSCVLIDCAKPYAHQPDADALWTLKWVHFNGAAMGDIYRKYLGRGGRCVFRPADPGAFTAAMDRIAVIAAGSSHIRDMELNGELAALLTLLMRQTVYEGKPGGAELRGGAGHAQAAEVKAYIDANYAQRLTLENLAERCYVEKTYLARIFKAQYGMTVMNYLYTVRVTRAKEMLRFTDETMDKIGETVGLENGNYFSRVFKKVEGISPREYRKRW